MRCSTYRLILGDALEQLRALPDESVQTCVTSPPYWGLRDYGAEGQIGLEETPEAFVARLVEVFREVRRALRPDGTLWLNLGDSYAGSWGAQGRQGATGALAGRSARAARQIAAAAKRERNTGAIKSPGLKPKDLVGIPWMVAFALRTDGWWLRSDVVWSKPNPMPESVTDRPTRAHEYLFLLSKSASYFYDADAIREPAQTEAAGNVERKYRGEHGGVTGSRAHQGFGVPWKSDGRGRNKRSVWTIATRPFPEAHFATFPEGLAEPCVLAGSREGDTVLDPFSGAATTGVVALKAGRSYVGIELNPEYLEMSERRLGSIAPLIARKAAS